VSNKKYNSDVAFLDVFLNALLGFVLLFIISWLLINPVAKNKTIDAKGEFIINVTWDEDANDDVDLWVQDPEGNTASFMQKEIGIMHLDRDDLGYLNDKITLSDGKIIEIKTNREVLTIRGIIPGEYVVNLHMFSKRKVTPINVKVEIIKINPYQVVIEKNIIMEKRGEEITVIRFTVNEEGKVIKLSELPKSLINIVDGANSGGVVR
jgi:hypothetical protein